MINNKIKTCPLIQFQVLPIFFEGNNTKICSFGFNSLIRKRENRSIVFAISNDGVFEMKINHESQKTKRKNHYI